MDSIVLNAIEIIYKTIDDTVSWHNSNITTRNTLNIIKGFKSTMNAVCSLMATMCEESRPAVFATCAYVTECRRIVTTRMASDHNEIYKSIINLCYSTIDFLKKTFDTEVNDLFEDEVNPFTNPEMYLSESDEI